MASCSFGEIILFAFYFRHRLGGLPPSLEIDLSHRRLRSGFDAFEFGRVHPAIFQCQRHEAKPANALEIIAEGNSIAILYAMLPATSGIRSCEEEAQKKTPAGVIQGGSIGACTIPRLSSAKPYQTLQGHHIAI
jgi:hypothetical protein